MLRAWPLSFARVTVLFVFFLPPIESTAIVNTLEHSDYAGLRLYQAQLQSKQIKESTFTKRLDKPVGIPVFCARATLNNH